MGRNKNSCHRLGLGLGLGLGFELGLGIWLGLGLFEGTITLVIVPHPIFTPSPPPRPSLCPNPPLTLPCPQYDEQDSKLHAGMMAAERLAAKASAHKGGMPKILDHALLAGLTGGISNESGWGEVRLFWAGVGMADWGWDWDWVWDRGWGWVMFIATVRVRVRVRGDTPWAKPLVHS